MATKQSTFPTSADPKALVMRPQVRTERNEKADAEFFESVKVQGVLQPILVRPVGAKLEVIAGHRRTEAAIAAGLKSVPILVKPMSDAEVRRAQLIENVQREGLSLLDTARGVQAIHAESGATVTSTAAALSKSAGWVSKMLIVSGAEKSNPSTSTITRKLLEADKIGDLESAYMLTKLEEVNPVAAQEIADNIDNETRASIKRKLQSAKPVKPAGKGQQTEEDDNVPMYRWMLKVIQAASVSRKDQPLQAAAAEMIQGWIDGEGDE